MHFNTMKLEQIETLKDHLGEHDVQLNKIYEAIENLLMIRADKELKENAWKNQEKNWL